MTEPLKVEIIAYAPTAFYHCMHCEVAFREMGKSNNVEKEQLASSLPADLLDEYAALSDWVRNMFRIHCDRIVISVIDAASVEGFYKALKYNAHRYPAIILDGHTRFSGSQNLGAAAIEIGRRLGPQAVAA